MYLVISKCVTAVKVSYFSGHYLRNRSNLDIGVLGYIGILQHKEHPSEVWHIPPGTPCISDLLINSSHTNVILLSVPHRHDLNSVLCVNRGVETFSSSLWNRLKCFGKVKLIDVIKERSMDNI